MTRTVCRFLAVAAIVSLCIALGDTHPSAQSPNASARALKRRSADPGDDARMSPMGRLAHRVAHGKLKGKALPNPPAEGDGDGGEEDNPAGGQSETSIAVSADGMHIVVGHNDTRGFSLNPFSVSGFRYSDDGGATWVDGGQLPTGPITGTINGESFPQVFGDPEVKYLGGSTFVYFSIMVKQISGTGTAQTMCVHRSTDNGHTWQGPFEIPAATNPHGQLSGANALDAADKEFADVDPDTGRVLMSWSNFTSTAFAAGGVEISTTFSDNLATATPPTWSSRAIVTNGGFDGQGSMPRFAGNGSSNVYVVWEQSASLNTTPPTPVNRIGFATSTNNGVSFGAPMTVEGVPATDTTGATFFKTMDYVLGNDRSHTMPAIAVDTSPAATHGNIYVVYANNANSDGADVVLRRSTNAGASFSSTLRLDSWPGADRAQWFPSVTVDQSNGRVYVFYDDQGIAADGDLTEYSYQFSDDGGVTWSRPAPLSDRPFHAGYGNDTGQPNLGDYNQGVAQGGELFAVWAATPPLVNFTDGVPAGQMTVPDVAFARVAAGRVALSLGAPAFSDAGPGTLGANGSIDPGETLTFTLPLKNYVSNAINQATITGISATLITITSGVTVTQGSSAYPNINANTSANNTTAFTVTTSPSFVSGTRIEFVLSVASTQGSTTLPFTQATGTPFTTTLLSENFDAGAALPAGWSSAHGGGVNTVNWTTSIVALGTAPQRVAISRAAFHVNANDGGVNANARWERLLSPTFAVPANAAYTTVEFDVAYDTENDLILNGLTYDGVFLRIFDATNNRTVAVEAFAETFATGTSTFYPKHLNRDDDPNYFQDLSAFGGDSRTQPGANANGFQHVRLKLPGMNGLNAQLRFEYTQDFTASCTAVRNTHTCGVLVDNVVVQSVQAVTPSTTLLAASVNPSAAGQSVTFTATVTTSSGGFATDGTVTFKEGATVLAGPTAINGSGQAFFATSALALGSHPISALYTPGSGLGTASSASVSQHVVVTASIGNVSVAEGNQGATTPAVFTVTLSQVSPETVTMNYATADGTATVAGFDYAAASGALTFTPGQTSKTIAVNVTGDSKPEFNETFFVNLSSVTNAIATSLQATGTITNDDAGTVVDAAAVTQSITSGANRLKQIQNPDGGWPYIVGTFVCGGAFGTCPNTIGTTALGLLATYVRTGDAASLASAVAAGNLLVSRYNIAVAQNPQGLPFSQDVEFLMWLAQVTGNTTYSTTATAWFQIAVNRFPSAAARINDLMTKRNAQGLRSNVAWDAASIIRAAKAVGNAQFALDTANAIVALEPQWKDTNPSHRFDQCGNPSAGCGPADNRFAFDFTLLGEGSLLWAVHDLPGFASKVAEYSAFLFAQQDPGGSWDVGDSQVTAYVVMGLAAIGGQASDNAMTLAGGFFINNQLANGGWPASVGAFANPAEIGEIDGESVRALNSLFNTAAGNGMSITPAQLARITFTAVSAPGQTTVVTLDPSSVPAPGPSYETVANIAYRVSTTATTTGSVDVCFSIPWVTDPAELAALRLLHLEGDSLVDRTILPTGSPLCARVSTLGPFVVARFRPDTTAPTATVTLSPAVLWPPNGRMVTITATIDGSDDRDPAPSVTLVSIESSEPAAGQIDGAAIGTDDRTFELRADRLGEGGGRVYTVTYRVTDASGNSRDIAAQVIVPHDQR